MGAKYQTISSSGYNSSPPPDDGTQSAANLVSWSTHKTKLTDPLKTEIDAINTALVTAFDYSVRQITASDSTVAGDHMRTVEIAPTVTTAVTVSLGDAASMTTVYRVFVKNSSAINQTVGRVTVGDTIDGTAANVTLAPGEGRILQTNGTPNGYLTVGRTTVYVHGADVASAATTNLDTATGDLVDVTGTTTITAITLANGQERTVRFTGALTLTNGASLVLPGAANITTAAGDYAIFRGYASGVVRCVVYTKASGKAINGTATLPTVQTFASGSGTYTPPALVTRYDVLLVGAGGGGGGGGTGPGAGGTGGNTTFDTYTAAGGVGGTNGGNGGAGGAATAAGSASKLVLFAVPGGMGNPGQNSVANASGGNGGSTVLGGAGTGGNTGSAGSAGATNTGGGGGGGGVGAGANTGSGGGSGAAVNVINTAPAAVSYSIGAAGTAGAGTLTGGAGGSGYIRVIEYYD